MSYKQRIRKKRNRQLLDSIISTGYFVNCNYHPTKLTGYSWNKWNPDVSGIALTNNGKCSCSLAHCGPDPIVESQALEMVAIWQKGGDRALAIYYGGYTEEQYTEFEKMWRS